LIPEERADHNKDISEATSVLMYYSIPHFAAKLAQITDPVARTNYPLIESLHQHGINCRYLGIVRANLSVKDQKYWRFILLIVSILHQKSSLITQIILRK
jgi:hypothetical protein